MKTKAISLLIVLFVIGFMGTAFECLNQGTAFAQSEVRQSGLPEMKSRQNTKTHFIGQCLYCMGRGERTKRPSGEFKQVT